MYRDTNGSGNTHTEQDDDKRKLEEYKEALDRIEGGLGPVGSRDLNDDSIPTKPEPKDD